MTLTVPVWKRVVSVSVVVAGVAIIVLILFGPAFMRRLEPYLSITTSLFMAAYALLLTANLIRLRRSPLIHDAGPNVFRSLLWLYAAVSLALAIFSGSHGPGLSAFGSRAYSFSTALIAALWALGRLQLRAGGLRTHTQWLPWSSVTGYTWVDRKDLIVEAETRVGPVRASFTVPAEHRAAFREGLEAHLKHSEPSPSHLEPGNHA